MQKSINNDDLITLRSELELYSKMGVQLSLHGKPSNPYNITKACKVYESQATYMRDYISDDDGNVREIDFRCIRSFKTK